MVTYVQLWSVDPAAWRRAASAWQEALGLVGRRIAELSGSAVAVRSSWSSPAGGSAARAVDGSGARLATSRPALVEIDQVLAEHAGLLSRARAALAATVEAAAKAGVLVDQHGTASPDPVRWISDPRGGDAAVRAVRAGIRAALDSAAVADRDTARRLTGLAAEATRGWPAEPPADRPPPGAEPTVVRRWWDGLTAAQRRWLMRYEPAIGRLDGVPVAVRDQVNRLLLAEQRAGLTHRLAELRASCPTADRRRELSRIEGALAGLDAVAVRLAADLGPRYYLLGLDPAGDGRVVMAVGNPDRADNVLTYVPGMTSDLRGSDGELERAFRVAQRCVELSPTERTAAVLWLDYDAPDFVHEAFRTSFAHDAGPALHRFQEGLRATHDGPPAHQTVLGHSYGSLVVGATARDHGLAADSLVFVGSPGVGVDHARDLGVPTTQVWSSTAPNDIIQYAAPAVDQLLEQATAAAARPVLGPALLVTPDDELWFGHNPSHRDFGARAFSGDPRGHTGYWDRGNPALDAMARIALGGHHQFAVR